MYKTKSEFSGFARQKPTTSRRARQQVRPKNKTELTTMRQEEGVRLQKVLAEHGLGSRRQMETLIAEGQVSVNNEVATLGTKVLTSDRIRVRGKLLHRHTQHALPRVLIYHKQEGEIVSRADPEGRKSVFDQIPRLKSLKWIAIGRLDYNTEGLLIFTTSGELANRFMHPRYQIEREYAVRLLGELTETHIQALKTGLELEDGLVKVKAIQVLAGEGVNRWYRITLTEGRNRVVRRVFETLGFTVSRLLRVRFGNVTLPPRLKRGQWQELTDDDVRKIVQFLPTEGVPMEVDPEEETGLLDY